MQEGVLASAPYALLFGISRGTCPLCPKAQNASVYLKANKDFNNEFLEDGKILKVWRSPGVLASAPSALPDRGCICTLCRTAPHASVI